MSTCQIFILTCQLFMSTCQKEIITISYLLSSFYDVLTLFAAIYLSILYLTSRHNLLTKRHNFLTSRHNDLTSRHNYLTSDGRNKPPLMFIGGGLECCSVLYNCICRIGVHVNINPWYNMYWHGVCCLPWDHKRVLLKHFGDHTGTSTILYYIRNIV